jgi:hypothetical protein
VSLEQAGHAQSWSILLSGSFVHFMIISTGSPSERISRAIASLPSSMPSSLPTGHLVIEQESSKLVHLNPCRKRKSILFDFVF